MTCIASLRANLRVSDKRKRNLPILKKVRETRPVPANEDESALSNLAHKLAEPIIQSIDEPEDIASVCGGATLGLVISAIFVVNPVIGFFAGGLAGLAVRQGFISYTEFPKLKEECVQWLERYEELGDETKAYRLQILVDDIEKVPNISKKEVKRRLKEIRDLN